MASDLSDRTEDYLRSIHRIVSEKGFARIKDVSHDLDVKPSSAVEMVRKLSDLGLVRYEKYGGITLTGQGTEIAEVIEKRRETFRKFLSIILVPEKIAADDAHILEHRLHPETILQFTRFVEFVTTTREHPRFLARWWEEFKQFCDQQKTPRRKV